MFRRIFTCSALIFFLIWPYAGECRPPVFDLARATDYAQRNSPFLKAKASEIEAQKGDRLATRASLLPVLSLNGDYTRYKLDHGILTGVTGEDQKTDNERLSGGVRFNFVAFDFGKNYFNYQGATCRVKSKENEYERVRQTLIFNVSRIYYSLITVDKTIGATNTTIQSLKALENETEKKVEVGRLPEVDLLKIQVGLSKSIDDLSRLKTLREELTGELKRLMGYREESEPEFTFEPVRTVEQKAFDIEKLIIAAYAGRDDLKSIEHNIQGLEYQIRSVKASYLPRIDLEAGYSEQAPGDGDFKTDGQAGVVVSMPIFDGFYRKGRTGKLAAEKGRLKFLWQDKKLEIEKEVRTAVKDYQETLTRVHSTKRSVDHAEEVLRIEKLKYDLGRTTINFVLEAEGALLTSRSLFYKAYYDYFIAEDAIALAVGNLHRTGTTGLADQLCPSGSELEFGAGNSAQLSVESRNVFRKVRDRK